MQRAVKKPFSDNEWVGALGNQFFHIFSINVKGKNFWNQLRCLLDFGGKSIESYTNPKNTTFWNKVCPKYALLITWKTNTVYKECISPYYSSEKITLKLLDKYILFRQTELN